MKSKRKGKTAKAKAAPVRRRRFRIDRPAAATVLLCLGVAVYYALKSTGTYQDDDVDHYFMARQALRDPSLFLDRWGMPLLTLLIALPARIFGYLGVELTTAAVTATAAWFTIRAGRSLHFKFAWAGALFLLFQPLALELCYSALAEPLAACLLAMVLAFWYGGRPGAALVTAGFLPVARIEAGFILAVVLAVAWRQVGWRPRLAALAPVFLWNLLGFFQTGQWLFVLVPGSTRPLNSLGPLHYGRNLIVIVGPVILFFVVWGLVSRFARDPKDKDRFPLLAAGLALSHLVVLSLLAAESIPFGRSIGFLRHALVVAPALALVAVYGLNDWVAGHSRGRALRLSAAGLWTAAVFFFFSHELIGHSFVGEDSVPMRWIVTAALAVLGALFVFGVRLGGQRAALVAAAGAVAWALVAVKPVGLNVEREVVFKAVTYLEDHNITDRIVYTNHPWFTFLSGRDRYDLEMTPRLTLANLETAPPGSIVLWENHYGHRLFGDVPLETLRADKRFERVLEMEGSIFRLVGFRRVP